MHSSSYVIEPRANERSKRDDMAKAKQLKTSEETSKETQAEYRQRIVDMICAVVASSEQGLGRICEAFKKDDEIFPHESTVRMWMREDEELATQYARAKEDQIEKLVDQIVEISDDDSMDIGFREDGSTYVNTEHIQRSKLRVDSRKWIASKLKPKKYGDKIEQTLQNPDGTKLDLTVNFVSPPHG